MREIVACEEVHPLADGEVRLLGAARQVTGATTRVEMGGKALLVDCGIGQGHEQVRFDERARDVDAVVLTHGHQDHIGNLPTLLEHGFTKPIYATQATLEIAALSLEDSLRMQHVPPRDVHDFLALFKRLGQAVPYEKTIETVRSRSTTSVDVGGLQLRFHEAGHILGSASVEIRSAQSRVICSGDLGRTGSPILRDPNTSWDASRPVDLVVMESTYGARDHAHTHQDIERDLERILVSAAARKAKVLIPAFAIGRTQVLLYFLNSLVESGRIPEIPVAIDTPMGLAMTETYARFRGLYDKQALDLLAHGDDPLDFEKLFRIKRGSDSARLDKMPGPMIIIAGSGMCTGGRIMGHLQRGLPDRNTTVVFVGYQGEGTTGRHIQNAAKTGENVWIAGENVAVHAHVETLKGLSAHADRTELRSWLSAIPEVKRVALHHGDPESQRAFVAFAK